MIVSLFAAVPMTVNATSPSESGSGEIGTGIEIGTGHALTLYANNGTDQQYTTGKKISGNTAISDPSYYEFTTPTGKTFRCWNTAADGTGTDYTKGYYEHDKADLTLYAQWGYTVTWKDWDDTLLKAEVLAEGTTPTYDGTPEKAEDENYTYTFSGWSPEITAVTGDVTYTATFTPVPKVIPAKLILHVGENGKVVMDNGTFGNATDASNIVIIPAPVNVADGCKVFIVDDRTANLVEGGSINIATGGEVSLYPSADNTGKITAIPDEGYICTGWYNGDTLYSSDAALSYQSISENITLTAKFALAYTVTWKNWNGDVLETDTVAADATPSYDGATPERPEDANNTYTFAAWDNGTTTYMNGVDPLPPVEGDITYTAVYTADPKGINYGGDNYIDPKGTQGVSSSDEGKTKFGLNLGSYLNMQMLGIQLKSAIATQGGDDGVRFVTVVNSNLLKGDNIEDYGYIVAKINSNVDTLYNNMGKFTAEKFIAQGAADTNIFTCKGSSNSISGEFGQFSSDTDYKYVTLSVTGTNGKSGNLVARFYVKTKDGQYHYADYINGSKQTYSGMAFSLSAVSANLG